MAKPSSSTAVAATDPAANLPAEYGMYEEYAGAGFENHTGDDYAIPFVHILQALSPQIEQNPELRQGMIINTVTGETFAGADGVAFIPACTQHAYVEWKPRSAGGGFVATHEPTSELVKRCVAASQQFGKYVTPDGNDLIETFYVFGILDEGDGVYSQAVVAFTSSKIKRYKAWMTKAKTIQIQLPNGRRIPAPLFSHRYRMKTVSEKNNKGTFYNWDVAFDGADAMACRLMPNDPMFQAAVTTKEMIEGGKARAAHETQATSGEGEESAEGATGGKPVF